METGPGSYVRHGRADALPRASTSSTRSWTPPTSPIRRSRWRSGASWWRRSSAAVHRRRAPQRADAPDMVYAMNLGLGLVAEDGATGRCVMSHMRHPQRRMETESAQPWFAERGFATSYVGRDGVGAPGGRWTRSRSATRWWWATARAPEELAPAAPGVRPGHPGPRAADHAPAGCTTSTWPSARSTSAARWSARPPGRGLGRGAARPGARAAGADRGADGAELDRSCANSIVIG